jgi:hypothetical protein
MPDRDHMGMLHLDAAADATAPQFTATAPRPMAKGPQAGSRWVADEVAPGTRRGPSAGASAAKVPTMSERCRPFETWT